MILKSSLCNMPLEVDFGVPLELVGSLRHQASPKLRLRDEDEEEVEGGKGVTLGTQKRRRRQKVFDTEVPIGERTQCAESPKVPRATLEVGGVSSSATASSPRDATKLSYLGLVKDPGHECVTTLSTFTGIITFQMGNLTTCCDYVEKASLYSFRHSLQVNVRYHNILIFIYIVHT